MSEVNGEKDFPQERGEENAPLRRCSFRKIRNMEMRKKEKKGGSYTKRKR